MCVCVCAHVHGVRAMRSYPGRMLTPLNRIPSTTRQITAQGTGALTSRLTSDCTLLGAIFTTNVNVCLQVSRSSVSQSLHPTCARMALPINLARLRLCTARILIPPSLPCILTPPSTYPHTPTSTVRHQPRRLHRLPLRLRRPLGRGIPGPRVGLHGDYSDVRRARQEAAEGGEY